MQVLENNEKLIDTICNIFNICKTGLDKFRRHEVLEY